MDESSLLIDWDTRGARYYRNAVERRWDPHDIDLGADRVALHDASPDALDGLRGSLAKFGAGERAVTEDLAPLAVALGPLEDQLFLATQLYEEAVHTDFFDRYWREVVWPVEHGRGLTRTTPTDDRWFDDDYRELFERNEAAMARLLTDDSPESLALAFCHYHLAIEGVLAQAGYAALTESYGGGDGLSLPGLVEGLSRIRGDEGRHVGFGMAKLEALLDEEGVDADLVVDTADALLDLVCGSLGAHLADYARRTCDERIGQLLDADTEFPEGTDPTRLE